LLTDDSAYVIVVGERPGWSVIGGHGGLKEEALPARLIQASSGRGGGG
jgi:hypothetical protein